MSGEFPKIPNEAKSFNDMVAWAAEHGQAESVRELLDAAKTKDWDGALDAVHRLEGMSDLADKAGAIGKHFDTIDKVGKALEIAQAVEQGDYTYAGAKLGAEVVDSVASGYLDSLGPGGIMLNYAVHETGDVMSSYLTEAQQFGPDAGLAEASGNEAAVSAYKTNRDYMENQIREQVDAGRSPEEVQQWTHDHMDAHGAIYNNLDSMQDKGESFANRFEKDLNWAAERTEAIVKEGEAQPEESNNGPSFFTPFLDAAKETFSDMKETAGEARDFVVEQLKEDGSAETAEAIAKADETKSGANDDDRGVLGQMTGALGKLNEIFERSEDASTAQTTEASLEPEPTEPPFAQMAEALRGNVGETFEAESEELDVSVASANSNAEFIEATPATPAPLEVVSELEIPLPPATEQPIEYTLEQPQVARSENAAHSDNTPPPATEVVVDTELTETQKLDAYVSQMARDAESQAAEQSLAGQEPPPATEIVIVDTGSDVIELAQPWEEHLIEEAEADTSDGPDSYV